MRTAVVCLAGAIASGKTEIARSLATQLTCGFASFGDYVRSVARERGLSGDRAQLQRLGEFLVNSNIDAFCAAVLAHADWRPGTSLVLDGLRHVDVLEAVRRAISPTPVWLLYLATPDDIRAARLATTRPAEAERLDVLDAHSTEIQVREALRTAADLVLDGTQNRDRLVTQILAWLDPLRSA
jgi:cytidylate kinase